MRLAYNLLATIIMSISSVTESSCGFIHHRPKLNQNYPQSAEFEYDTIVSVSSFCSSRGTQFGSISGGYILLSRHNCFWFHHSSSAIEQRRDWQWTQCAEARIRLGSCHSAQKRTSRVVYRTDRHQSRVRISRFGFRTYLDRVLTSFHP